MYGLDDLISRYTNCQRSTKCIFSFCGRFFAGTIDLSLADIVFMANFASLIECQFYPNIFEDFPALKEWFEKCKKLIPNYEKSNGQGAKMFGAWFKSGLKK